MIQLVTEHFDLNLELYGPNLMLLFHFRMCVALVLAEVRRGTTDLTVRLLHDYLPRLVGWGWR